MAQSIRISNELYESAATAAQLQTRSLAQQLEHWARLGRALEQSGATTSETAGLALAVRLAVRHDRDRQRISRGELHPEAMFAIPRERARRATVEFPKLDFEELARDYR